MEVNFTVQHDEKKQDVVGGDASLPVEIVHKHDLFIQKLGEYGPTIRQCRSCEVSWMLDRSYGDAVWVEIGTRSPRYDKASEDE